jgi:predicted nucleic acid-binding Zn ribbon protein
MELISAGGIVKKVLYDIAGAEYKDLVTIILCWKHIVGKLLAERAKIQGFQNKTLYVAVSNNVWMQELVLHKKIMIKKIKKELDIDVQNIIFYIKSF